MRNSFWNLLKLRIARFLKYRSAPAPAPALSPVPILHSLLWESAARESADFVKQYIGEVLIFKSFHQIHDHAIERIKEQKIGGVCLEFGVYKGRSINYFASRLPELDFVGFDSFEGLAEDWTGHHARKGTFNLDGELPEVKQNVRLVKGWFDQTLPKYCQESLRGKSVRFIHVDGDTFEAATIVFKNLSGHLKPGVLILFDELIGYPNWKNGEFLAWKNITSEHSINFRYISFCTHQALVEIIE